ncbi:MAG TPA: hypothetical protein VE010_16950 [Thermoanaerobaculia bacterium]|nr:hypothetical protein [Thermoanaerobaculia bacterium]
MPAREARGTATSAAQADSRNATLPMCLDDSTTSVLSLHRPAALSITPPAAGLIVVVSSCRVPFDH